MEKTQETQALQEKFYLKIESRGERLGSPDVSKRMYYLNVEYSSMRITDVDVNGFINVYNDLVTIWSPHKPMIEEVYGYHIKSAVAWQWWIYYYPCKYCKARYEKNLGQWIEGKSLAMSLTPRQELCLRHYVVEHVKDVEILDNKPRIIELTDKRIWAKLVTNNYDYEIDIDRGSAVINVTYKGRQYTFRYNNHVNAYPLASSYHVLIENIFDLLRDYVLTILNIVENDVHDYNAILTLNGKKYEVAAKAAKAES